MVVVSVIKRPLGKKMVHIKWPEISSAVYQIEIMLMIISDCRGPKYR